MDCVQDQCGGGDRLSEGIISTSVKLVGVGKLNYQHNTVPINNYNCTITGSPSNLHTVSNRNDIVTLSWSPPLTSADYCTSNDCFEYTVNLADFNKAFYTNDITLSINTTAEEFDQCSTFFWSVIAITNSFETSKAVANRSIVLQTSLLVLRISMRYFIVCYCRG